VFLWKRVEVGAFYFFACDKWGTNGYKISAMFLRKSVSAGVTRSTPEFERPSKS